MTTTKPKSVELPELLHGVAKHFKLETALLLADKFGGQRITIGKKISTKSELVQALGYDVVRYLQKTYGHGPLLVPIGPASEYKRRTRLVRQLIVGGEHSTSQIVKLVRVHTRTVEWNRQQLRLRRDKRQLLLFS